jgi:hypothetical protein
MKKLLLLVTMLTTISVKAQSIDSLSTKDGKVFYESIVDMQSKTKDQLYKAARKWFVDSFNNSKSVLRTEDKEGGELVGKGNFLISENGGFMITNNYRFDFTIEVVCKDNKYRVRIYDISYTMTNPPTGIMPSTVADLPAEGYNDRLKKSKNKRVHENALLLDLKFKSMIDSLKVKMTSATNDDF